jgi:hypothetical protein
MTGDEVSPKRSESFGAKADEASTEGAAIGGAKAGTQNQWLRVMDTVTPQTTARAFRGGCRYPLQGRSVAMFKMTPPILERRRSLPAVVRHEPVEAGEPAPAGAKS